MHGTYLDAVVDDLNWPLYNDVPEKVKEWIQDNPELAEGNSVVVGRTLKYMSIAEYMEPDEPVGDGPTEP